MRLLLHLNTLFSSNILPVNYQYCTSAVIYRIIESADAEYAQFLHNDGYGEGLKRFKLFTFSDISTPFKINGDRLHLTTNQAKLIVCFHLPKAAENFIRGLFINQRIEIADKKSKVVFSISQVETIPSGIEQLDGINEISVKPVSPLVCGEKLENGNYEYLSPEDNRFILSFIFNWKEKYKTLYGEESCAKIFSGVSVEPIYNKLPPKSRLITIKADTPAETKIRGFVNFSLKIKADASALELLLNAGAGLYNSQGMGCLEMINLN